MASRGGNVRKKILTKEQRSVIAKKAPVTRWGNNLSVFALVVGLGLGGQLVGQAPVATEIRIKPAGQVGDYDFRLEGVTVPDALENRIKQERLKQLQLANMTPEEREAYRRKQALKVEEEQKKAEQKAAKRAAKRATREAAAKS